MIEIVCQQTGDRAEAATPEDAVAAGIQLCKDAWDGNPVQGFAPTVAFFVDGKPVVSLVSEARLWDVNSRRSQ